MQNILFLKIMKNTKIILNLLPAILFILGIAVGSAWAYQLSKEQLEIKKSLRKNPLEDVILALTYIANADNDLSPSESKIIFSTLQKLNIRKPEQIAHFEKLMDVAQDTNLDIPQISYNIKRTNNPLMIQLVSSIGSLITKDDGTVASRELAMLADILDYMGIKTDSNW